MNEIGLIFKWPYCLILFHLLLGFTGFLMYLSNPNSRPNKLRFYLFPLIMFHLTGLLGLFYGYVCFSTRKKIQSIAENIKTS